MTGYYKRKTHYSRKLSFTESINKYGFLNALTYRIKKLGIPPWFLLALIGLFSIPVINWYYQIKVFSTEVLPTLFYILEILVVGYIMFRLLKRLDRIYISSNLRLFGLRILSGIIGGIGAYLSILFLMFGMPIIMMGTMGNFETIRSMYSFFGLGFLVDIFFFGNSFYLPFTGVILYMVVALSLSIIGGYLFFKFQRKSGQFVWVGRV